MTKWPTDNSAYFTIGRFGALVLTPDRKPAVKMTTGAVAACPSNDNGPIAASVPGGCGR